MGKSVVNQHQPSITEWFSAIGEIEQSNSFRDEDNKKNDRLETLYNIIGFPYEHPDKLEATELTNKSPRFQKILAERGDELCAIRLVPKLNHLPKIRNRGLTIRECYETWYLKQDINPKNYFAYICPHTDDLLWSSIFVINVDMIFGEIIRGMHNQLTQGDIINTPYRFQFNYRNWSWSDKNSDAKAAIKRITQCTYVPDKTKQAKISNKLDVAFTHDYMKGYFEGVIWPDEKVRFTDFNRLLPEYIPTPLPFSTQQPTAGNLKGIPAYPGIIKAAAIQVKAENIGSTNFPAGSILICDNTDARFLPLMQKAGAIITERGGILSHAAIIARELKKPCVIGVKDITKTIKTGKIIEINANTGIIKIK